MNINIIYRVHFKLLHIRSPYGANEIEFNLLFY